MNIKQFVSPTIIGGIAIVARMTREAVEACPFEFENGSSNFNNHQYVIFLPGAVCAVVYRDDGADRMFDLGPQRVEIVDAWLLDVESAGMFIHPDIADS